MSWRYALAVAIAAAGAPFAAQAAAPNPAVVQQEIDRVGGDAVVAGLFRSGQWDFVQSRVSAGDPAWIHIAGTLLHTPLGCASCAESLPISLAVSMEHNPAAVLASLGSDSDIDRVCGAPFVEPPPLFLTAHIDNVVRALHAVSDPALATRRDACLAQLRRTSALNAVQPRMNR